MKNEETVCGFLICLLPLVAMAGVDEKEDFEVGLLRGGGATVVEMKYNFGDFEPFVLSQIDASGPWMSWGYGLDYELASGKKAALDVGIVWLARLNRMNGTNWNSHFELTYDIAPEVAISVSHISHGAKFGIWPDKPNRGWNWVGLVFKW